MENISLEELYDPGKSVVLRNAHSASMSLMNMLNELGVLGSLNEEQKTVLAELIWKIIDLVPAVMATRLGET